MGKNISMVPALFSPLPYIWSPHYLNPSGLYLQGPQFFRETSQRIRRQLMLCGANHYFMLKVLDRVIICVACNPGKQVGGQGCWR